MIRTLVGYTGGRKERPIYTRIGDHSEAIEIVFDPSQITFERLLEVFWESHNPAAPSMSRQYRSAIFFHNDEQKERAAASKEVRERILGRKITTALEAASHFTRAEDYHQKYYLRMIRSLVEEISRDEHRGEWVETTAAARINGYLGGWGGPDQLESAMDSFQLSDATRTEVRRIGASMGAEAAPRVGSW